MLTGLMRQKVNPQFKKGVRSTLRPSRFITTVATLGAATALVLLAMFSSGYLSPRPGLAQDAQPTGTTTPAGTPTPLPIPTRTANALESTVAAVSPQDNSITINAPRGGLQTIQLPENITVIRNSQPASLDQVEATDRVIIQRGAGNRILSVLAFAVTPTVAPTLTVGPGATQTAIPAATTVGTPAAPQPTGTPGSQVYNGTVTQVGEGRITVLGDDGTERPVVAAEAPNLQVIRDGEPAGLGDVRANDAVTVTYGANNVPTRLEARSTPESAAATGADLRWLLYLLPMLALLLAPLLLTLTGRRPSGNFMMMRRRG